MGRSELASHPVFDRSEAPEGVPQHQLRAHHTENSIFVFQAFRGEIGETAVRKQRFVEPFSRNRMTWIKPSFAWMMYRSGWASKPGQECVLRIEISREGFEWALANSALATFGQADDLTHDAWRRSLQTNPIRIQWDPERTLQMEPLPWRTIQMGVGGEAIDRYVDEWVMKIENVTHTVRKIEQAVRNGDHAIVGRLLSVESPYPLPTAIARQIAASHSGREQAPPA